MTVITVFSFNYVEIHGKVPIFRVCARFVYWSLYLSLSNVVVMLLCFEETLCICDIGVVLEKNC